MTCIQSKKRPGYLKTHIPADHPSLCLVGRIDTKEPENLSFSFPGVSLTLNFKGNSIGIILTDTGSENYFNIIIDGKEPIIIQTAKDRRIYTIQELSPGNHTLELYKRTESFCGITTFQGLLLPEEDSLLSPPALPSRKLEFIGDSITCGYGNEVSTHDPDNFHFNPQNENSSLSWAAIAARKMDASFHLTSYSGRGLYRNIDGTTRGTLPELYTAIFPDQPDRAEWKPERYTPDIIVLNLGTNDYGSLDQIRDITPDELDQKFTATYKTFIYSLQQTYGENLEIICCVGPMMTDSYPEGVHSWSRIQKNVSGLVKDFRDQGCNKIHYLPFPPQKAPYGEDWHPTVETHKQMADIVIPVLSEFLRMV